MDKNNSLRAPTWVDSVGAAVSVACAIQCTVFPLLISVLPLLGLGFLAGDGVEKVFLGVSIALAGGSFGLGFRHHRHLYVFYFLLSGLALIFTGRVWLKDEFELPFVVFGTTVFTVGHLLNRRLCRLCADCEGHRQREASIETERIGEDDRASN
jgi:hypothetical protein